ncbi:MAG: efflux RND transporter periplasmic adaptor subunit [Bacteroidales bacterium]|jgi:RND family efflux transporter MFP subunit|nr:efflux RND transporter periplasmic adaptor subunit [Bacteroidales bacterium]MDD2571142.1 efflux RND transporter periplasmic adaptor subunit [Bacteroidales bacterium]MDD3384526.1 efflux RND transporter periplasmic adaptor subunit [Bacteroidales bacterium]MDD3811653.1 efflux RND transporter periplasmic adaptor subunit [Bacteroidales bacterium]MDD3871709.1 efflux RND transporter periplasmic adaptor subunit [Bacteroidales bacterium]
MKSIRNPLVVLVFSGLTLILINGCRTQQTDATTEVAVPVSIMDIRPASIEEYIETNGTVYPTQEVELKSEMTGRYYLQNNPRTGRPWALGDRVRTGDLIVKFEDEEYVSNIQIDSKRINLEVSKNEVEKQQSLYEKGGATLRELKNSEQTFINADYAYKSAQLQLQKMNVIAPFDGVIVDLPYYTKGNKLSSGQSLVKIMDYRKLYMEFQLPEKNLTNVNVNQRVRVLNYALPDDTLYGNISQLSPAINPDTRSFKGTIMIQNDDLRLRPGSYIKSEIITLRNDSTIVIPKKIIVSRQRGKTVFVVDQNTAMERVITTGLENPDSVEVIRGLKMNDRVVIEGFETLGNRSKVKIVR